MQLPSPLHGHPWVRLRVQWLGRGGVEVVEALDALALVVVDGVAVLVHGHRGVGVAQEFGESDHVHALLQTSCGEGVTEGVEVGVTDARLPHAPLEQVLVGSRLVWVAVLLAEHVPVRVVGRVLFLYSRLVYGARVSLLTGVAATLMAVFIGSFLGMVAAYFGGTADKLLLGFCNIFNAIPRVAMSMTLITLFGGGMMNMAVIMCVGMIPSMSRMMRASALSIMNHDYILAAKLSGQSKLKLMYKHVLPNSISPLIVSATQNVGMTILMESGLSFLGVGIKIPMASWGSIINEARSYLMTDPLYVLAPCICLALLIISLNLLGDGVRDALDPSLRGEV